MDLTGKINLCIVYKIYNDKDFYVELDKYINDEKQLKQFLNELLETQKNNQFIKIEIVEIINNLGYQKD